MEYFARRSRRGKKAFACDADVDQGVVVEILSKSLDQATEGDKKNGKRERAFLQFLQEYERCDDVS